MPACVTTNEKQFVTEMMNYWPQYEVFRKSPEGPIVTFPEGPIVCILQ